MVDDVGSKLATSARKCDGESLILMDIDDNDDE